MTALSGGQRAVWFDAICDSTPEAIAAYQAHQSAMITAAQQQQQPTNRIIMP